MEVFEQIKGYINNANTIALATHVFVDGDAVGSVGAMYHMLKEMGKKAKAARVLQVLFSAFLVCL